MSNIPTLALIPSAYKTSKVYSVLPSNGDGDFTFTRTGEATRVNQAGLIETVASNVPRLDYSDGSCPSLLLEPQRTNNILNSESLSNASWIKFNSGLGAAPITTDNYAFSPSGEMNASRLQISLGGGTTSSDRVFIRQSLTNQTDYYFSVYLKSANGSEQKLVWHFGSDDFLITVTDEWQRFELSRNGAATTWVGLGLRGNLVSALGIDDSVDILVYGFQAEQGGYATSCIPTSGSISTRSKDACNGSVNAALFNDDEGVLFVETKGFVDIPATSTYIQLSKNGESGFTNSLVIQHRNNGWLNISANSSASTDLHFNINIDFNQNHKIAVLYKLNGYKLFIDGVAQSLFGTPTQTVFSGLNDLSFNLRGSNGWNAKIKDLRYYNTALTEAELTELTTL